MCFPNTVEIFVIAHTITATVPVRLVVVDTVFVMSDIDLGVSHSSFRIPTWLYCMFRRGSEWSFHIPLRYDCVHCVIIP